ncbi:hypothetical protein CHARACLAT_004220 [Characodon lateralis]|uniref:Uncharacterized protein n=1 Tax=Characodon lateralis TaxID=208331 RepID=A0ABU7DE28_9TELE|nr:hypothetical protein [Characodon lateralis]
MAFLLLWQQDMAMFSRLGRGQLMIFWAVFMTLCITFLSSADKPVYHTPVCQYTLHRGVIEGQQQLCVQIVLPEDTQEVEPLLGLLYQGSDIVDPGLVCGDEGGQEPEGGDIFNRAESHCLWVALQKVLNPVAGGEGAL